jgi:sugar phosphate isomerase/epimerase
MAVRLGGPVWAGSEDPLEIARAHRGQGYTAAYCPEVSLQDADRIRAIRDAFRQEDVLLAEVGAWCNMMAGDSQERRRNLDYVCERLAVAEEVGALCCVNIAGSLNSERWDGPHPDNVGQAAFDLTVENARHILDTVKPHRTRFAIEMMPWSIPDSPDSFAALVKAVDRPGFAVHLDPVNLIHSPPRYFNNGALIVECFEKLGRWIVSAHAKDIVLRNQLTTHLDEARPGTGALDYATFLTELSKHPKELPLLLEHLSTPEEYALAAQYVREVADRTGVRFV